MSHDSDSDDESFHSFHDDEPQPPLSEQKPSRRRSSRGVSESAHDEPTRPIIERFPPEEEAALLGESNSLKGSANQLFGSGSFENAIQTYDRALVSCPHYLDYEMAVLRSNVAACHIKLAEWKEAVDSASKGIECLERLEPLPKLKKAKLQKGAGGKETENGARLTDADAEDAAAETGVEEVDDALEERIEQLRISGHTLEEVRRLQVKLLMRRAKGRAEQTSWATLQGADEDYATLLTPTLLAVLSPSDRRQVGDATRVLGPKLTAAREHEMGEMMDKLKGLGNSILKPFGLSTENFQFVKDEKSGGYSMNFAQNPGKS